ncbi:AFG1-like ATPase-domain-containing protein [Amylostereum chailletii]|nr:AFG1-like ATPase-domain-containing protein [Amylostereum chailletii]
MYIIFSRRLIPRTPVQHALNCKPFSTDASCNDATRQVLLKSGLPQQTDLLEQYRGLVALGRITYDEDQVRAVMQLRRLRKDLNGYAPPALPSRYNPYKLGEIEAKGEKDVDLPWWLCHDHDAVEEETGMALIRIQSHAEELAALNTPKGLLVTGPPGSGKSFLIDMWFASLPTPYKTRKHYNQLVLEIYRAVWEETQIRMAVPANPVPSMRVPWTRGVREHWRTLVRTGNLSTSWARISTTPVTSHARPPLALVVAHRLLLQHWLLVLDEIQLLDVSSATLLADVLSWFWRMGGVLLRGKDWRIERARSGKDRTWFVYAQRSMFEQTLQRLVEPQSCTLRIFGRLLNVPWCSGDVCRFTFEELCEESLGPADYITLASTYSTFAITSIPVLKVSDKNQARRFISLIDALYEARCCLLCLAEVPLEDLFFPDGAANQRPTEHVDVDMMMAESVAESQDIYRPNISSYDAPKMEEALVQQKPLALETLSIFSGKEEQFVYKRALSRLLDMTSTKYAIEESWNPLSVKERRWEDQPAASANQAPQIMKYADERRDVRNYDDDFATEAAHAGAGTPTRGRPEAPRIRSRHVWGMGQTSSDES